MLTGGEETPQVGENNQLDYDDYAEPEARLSPIGVNKIDELSDCAPEQGSNHRQSL